MKRLIRNKVARCQPTSLRKKILSHILLYVFSFHFLRPHHVYFFQRGFQSVRVKFLSENMEIQARSIGSCNLPVQLRHLSQLPSCWMWDLTFSRVLFLSKKLEFFAIQIPLYCNLPHCGADFCDSKYFFSAESVIYQWQSHRFSFWTLLKIRVKILQISQENTSVEVSF